MNIASNETHHVFTEDEAETERKKICYRTLVLVTGGLLGALGVILMWVYRQDPSEAFEAMALVGIITLIGGSCVVTVSDPINHLAPLSTKGLNSLRELSEANPSVAVWIAEALEDGRTLRLRDLWAAEVIDCRRQALESQHEAEQAKRAALLDLRDSARDTVMSRQTV